MLGVTDSEQIAFYKNLGTRIRALRGRMSQEDLSQAVGLTRTSIVNLESGRQKLLVHNLFAIAEALGVKPSEILLPIEPTHGQVPAIEISGKEEDVNRWIRRGITKAIQARATQ